MGAVPGRQVRGCPSQNPHPAPPWGSSPHTVTGASWGHQWIHLGGKGRIMLLPAQGWDADSSRAKLRAQGCSSCRWERRSEGRALPGHPSTSIPKLTSENEEPWYTSYSFSRVQMITATFQKHEWVNFQLVWIQLSYGNEHQERAWPHAEAHTLKGETKGKLRSPVGPIFSLRKAEWLRETVF